MTAKTDLMIEESCLDFVTALASSAATPGGGGAVGLGGAIGIALANMVCNLTIGKKKYAEVEPEVQAILAQGSLLQQQLLATVAADAAVFEPLSQAYGLPKGTEQEQKFKKQTLSECSHAAATVPLNAANLLVECLHLTRRIADIGSNLVISDAGCAGAFLLAALKSAQLNVLINLGAIDDENYVTATKQQLAVLLDTGEKLAAEIEAIVLAKVS